MADHDQLPRRLQWLNATQKIAQILALLCAGVWVLYSFVLKESSKTYYITPSIEVRPASAREFLATKGKFRPFEVTLTVNNPSERDSYIIAGTTVAFGHKAEDRPDDRFFNKPIDTREGRSYMRMQPLRWSADRHPLSFVITFPSFRLARGDKATQRYVMLVPNSEYDILEVFAEFHVVNPCPGYLLNKCYVFSGAFNLNELGDWVSQFAFRENSMKEPVTITVDRLQNDFDYKTFQTTQMIVLRGGKLFQSLQKESDGAQ
jgi:hypothetical protein